MCFVSLLFVCHRFLCTSPVGFSFFLLGLCWMVVTTFFFLCVCFSRFVWSIGCTLLDIATFVSFRAIGIGGNSTMKFVSYSSISVINV